MGHRSEGASSHASTPTYADFTPNPDRSIRVEEKFNEVLLERLHPRILELTAQNREPIAVFINSGGGSAEVCVEILRLLTRTTQEDPRVSRIITVAAPDVGSAAANLLSAGDFAVASPESELLYHGGRWPLSDLVAAGECGLMYARTLPTFRKDKPAWDGGLSRISDHFYFLNSYIDVAKVCDWAGAEHQTADTDVEADYFLQFRLFFLALCRALQEGENYITAADAVWLGLIDTVRADFTSA